MFDFLFGDRRRREALDRGRFAVAQIVDIRDTHLRQDERIPVLAVRMNVSVDGAAPYLAETRMTPYGVKAAGVYPGAMVHCWVHPRRPAVVALAAPGQCVAPDREPLWARILELVLFWL